MKHGLIYGSDNTADRRGPSLDDLFLVHRVLFFFNPVVYFGPGCFHQLTHVMFKHTNIFVLRSFSLTLVNMIIFGLSAP